MKKKVLIAVCAVFVVLALVVSGWFIFSGLGEKPEADLPDMTGTWIVAAESTNEVVQFFEEQYIVFGDSEVTMYKNGEEFVNSKYTIDDALNLNLPDISGKYFMECKTENCVRLYENAAKYMILVKASAQEMSREKVTLDDLAGKWDVVLKGDQVNNGEILEIEGTHLDYYKAGEAQPFASPEVTMSEDSVLTAQGMNLTLVCYKVSDDVVIMIEGDGNTWEIHKAS